MLLQNVLSIYLLKLGQWLFFFTVCLKNGFTYELNYRLFHFRKASESSSMNKIFPHNFITNTPFFLLSDLYIGIFKRSITTLKKLAFYYIGVYYQD